MRAGWALFAVVLLLPVPGAAQDGGTWTREDFLHEAPDGTMLAASLYVPDGEGPFPAVLHTHGWGETHESADSVFWAERYAALGYVVLAFTSRGWGDSGGEVELDGPKEVADTRSLVDVLAADGRVLLDAPGDPRLAMVGKSYGGGIQFLTAREDPRIDAIVPLATWSDLMASLAPDEVLKLGWTSLLLGSGYAGGHGIPLGVGEPDPDAEGPSPKLAQWYAEYQATNEPSDEMREEIGVVRSLRAGDPLPPVLLVQGWPDTLFPPDEALRTFAYAAAQGVDARIVLYGGGHGGFGFTGFGEADDIVDDFLATHLRDAPPSLPPYPVVRARPGGDFVGELQWPPAGTDTRLLYLDDLALVPERPAAGAPNRALYASPVPTTCTEVPNFQDDTAGYCRGAALDATAARWTGAAFEAATEVTGAPVAFLHVLARTPREDTTLFLHLLDIGPDGQATTILRQVTPVRLGALAAATPVTVPMRTVSHTFEAGHRAGLLVASNDVAYSAAREPGLLAIVSNDATPSFVTLPVVPPDAWGDRVPPSFPAGAFRVSGDGEGVRVEVRVDDVGLGVRGVDVRADGLVLDATGREGHVWRFEAPAAPCDEPYTFLVNAMDHAGNEAGSEIRTPVCRTLDGPWQKLTSGPPREESPLAPVGLLLVAAALVASRRR